MVMKNIDFNRLSHAYIIESNSEEKLKEEGLSFAREIIDLSRINENTKTDDDFLSYVDLDIIEPVKNNISINQIRDITSGLYQNPFDSRKKVYLIINSELMNTQAQNALLKSFEEPPEYVVFILCTLNRFKLLDTIISRSQLIILDNKEDERDIDKLTLFRILDNTLNGDELEIFSNEDFFMQYRDNEKDLFKEVIKFFNDILRYKYTNGSFVENKEYLNIIKKNSNLTFSNLEKIIKRVEDIYNLLDVNINYQLAIEYMLLGIWEEGNHEYSRS